MTKASDTLIMTIAPERPAVDMGTRSRSGDPGAHRPSDPDARVRTRDTGARERSSDAEARLRGKADERRALQEAHRARIEQALAETEPDPFDNPLERIMRARRRKAAQALETRVPVVPEPLIPRQARSVVGTEGVATILDRLGDGWWVLDGIAVGDRGNVIDHLVIGPAGVFTVAGRHHENAAVVVEGSNVVVDGHRQPYVRTAQHQAQRASRLLSGALGRETPVRPVVAVVSSRLTLRAQPAGVVVMEGRSVPRFLGRQPATLTDGEVLAVVGAARRRSTWQPVRPTR